MNISTHLQKYFSQFFKKLFEEVEMFKKLDQNITGVPSNIIFTETIFAILMYYLEGKRKYHDINIYRV